jgi:hypothetical protein
MLAGGGPFKAGNSLRLAELALARVYFGGEEKKEVERKGGSCRCSLNNSINRFLRCRKRFTNVTVTLHTSATLAPTLSFLHPHLHLLNNSTNCYRVHAHALHLAILTHSHG